MYVTSLKWREKPGQPIIICPFFYVETQGVLHERDCWGSEVIPSASGITDMSQALQSTW